MGGCIDNYSHFFYWDGPNRHDLFRNGAEIHCPGRFFPDLMLEESRRFMEANHSRPFFLYFALNMPHYPYQADPKWLNIIKTCPIHGASTPPLHPPWMNGSAPARAAATAAVMPAGTPL
jgi:hypothetical protein